MARLAALRVVLGFLCVAASLSPVCSGENLNAHFVFGDSLVDPGNNNYIVTLSRANYLPNGIDFPPGRRPTGRFTNGRTIADILGEELGLQEFTPPYLAPSTVGASVLNGVNYASGAGGILNASGKTFGGRLNFDAQIDGYANTRQDIISSLGMPPALSLLRTSLFSVSMGSNDFINNYLTPFLSVPRRATTPPNAFVDAIISKYRKQLTRLYYLDARKILVTNVGPIGCIPYVRDLNPLAGADCVEFPNQLALRFNRRLRELVAELSSSLEGSMFVYADVYSIVADIIENYSSYGFEFADNACCYTAGRFGGLVPCVPTSKVCADRSKYVFWDAYHPSDAANVVITKILLDGDTDVIFPLNVRQLVEA